MAEREAVDIIADRVDKIACRKCGRHLDVSKLPSFSKVECPDCHTKQTVPAQLGHFLLLEILGAGGMGAVYQALDKQLGRYVAIKVMKRSLGEDPQFVENFLREARAAAALNHRNVVQIYSCGQEKGQPYIVMELVSCSRLDELIAQGNPLEEVKTLEIGIDIAEGLKAANDIGLIHGDIKPANILFDKNGAAKVVDFGLARFVTWQQDRGEVWGTPYYIAPEKARGQKVDHRSDIYSLGATLYHALGAKPPFDGKTATDVVLARLKNPAIGLRVIRPSLQPETADVIARMLEADPFMRYPTYASLLADLREALRFAKQEHRSVSGKVKKSPVTPLAMTVTIILISIGLLVSGLQWAASRKGKVETPESGEADLGEPRSERKSLLRGEPEPGTAGPPGTAKPPPGTAETTPSTTPRKTAAIVQPFTTAGEEALAAAVQQMVDGKPAAMRDQLQAVYDKSPPLGMGRYWVRLFQAVASWGGGRDQDALLYLQEIRNAMFESPDRSQPHPGAMPQTLARYMLREIEEGPVSFETARWPPWYADLAEFFLGLDALREGNLGKARDYLKSYAAKDGKNPAWPYSLRGVAQLCLDQMAEFSRLLDRSAQMIAAKQAGKGRAALEEFKFRASAFLHPLIDTEMARVRKAEQAELAETRRAERKARQEKVQADLDELDEVRNANLPLVGQKDFRKAAAAVIKLIPEIETPEGQQALVLLRESYDRMDALKKFLMERITKAPFRGGVGTELGGDAIGADLIGIRIALGQHGQMVMPWQEVSIRLFLQLANQYLGDAAVPEKERAAMILCAAVYCYENGGFKPAAQYAADAIKLDPTLKVEARKLMPDLLPD